MKVDCELFQPTSILIFVQASPGRGVTFTDLQTDLHRPLPVGVKRRFKRLKDYTSARNTWLPSALPQRQDVL